MVPLRRKLIAMNLFVLFLAILAFSSTMVYVLAKLTKEFSSLSTARSEHERSSYENISNENIAKIKTLYEQQFKSKGNQLLTKDSASLAPMISDNAVHSVQEFLQHTFEGDRDIVQASLFTLDHDNIMSWYYVSSSMNKGMSIPLTYSRLKLGWEGKTKDKAPIFIKDPDIIRLSKVTEPFLRFREISVGGQRSVVFDCVIPFVDGKTGKAVRDAKVKSERVGFLRYVLSLDEMNRAVAAEKATLESRLKSLESDNQVALRQFQEIMSNSKVHVLLVLAITAFLISLGGYFGSVVSAIRISTPIKILTQIAESMAKGNYIQKIELKSNDEVGILAHSFQEMSHAIRKRDEELALINANLEKLVEERTATIKVILNNVKCGFFLLGKNQEILEGFTQYCHTLFDGGLRAGTKFSEAFKVNSKEAGNLEVLLEQVFEDFLDESLNLSQIPGRFVLGARILHVVGSVVRAPDASVQSILFTVVDGTELERAEEEGRVHKVLIKLLQQADAFHGFVNDVRESLYVCKVAVKEKKAEAVRMILHTLKGNMHAFGLSEVGRMIHLVEDETTIEMQHVESVEQAFRKFLETHLSVLGVRFEESGEDVFQVRKSSLDQFVKVLEKASSEQDIRKASLDWLYDLQLKKAIDLLGPVKDYMESLAERSGKKLQFQIQNENALFDPKIARSIFQTLPHLLRNSLDHGIELPGDRGSKGEVGSITIGFESLSNESLIRVKDDGKGIDVERVCKKTIAKNLRTEAQISELSQDQKCRLIFLDGVSSSDGVSATSGRGVGMSAVLRAVEEAKGQIEVRSVANTGSEFVIHLPRQASRFSEDAERLLTHGDDGLARNAG